MQRNVLMMTTTIIARFHWIAGCGTLIFFLGIIQGNALGQVAGVCTQTDGRSWPMSHQPNAGVLPQEKLQAGTDRLDVASVKAFLARNDNPVANSVKPVVNRYSPHSVNSMNPHSSVPVSRASNRVRIGGDDDLLAPSGTSQIDDLLSPTIPSTGPIDPLSGMGPDREAEKLRTDRKVDTPANGQAALDPHLEAFANELYPSALTCAKCHKKIYDEWRVSGHAYAAISPMFQRFEQAVAELVRGTSGTFCVRCHAPVATQSDHPRESPIFAGPAVFRTGFANLVVLVLLALGCALVARIGANRHHGCRHRAFASGDFRTGVADVGAIEAELDALLATGFVETRIHTGQAGRSALGAIVAADVASFFFGLRGRTRSEKARQDSRGGAAHQHSTIHFKTLGW